MIIESLKKEESKVFKLNFNKNSMVSKKEIDFFSIEKKWQKLWEKKKIFEVKEIKGKKKKFFLLEMFPYPSSYGLHMGHALNYTIGDIYARFKRMNGFNVLYPMGYDSLGLPAENAAIKEKIHPKKYTEKAISNFIKQQKSLGLSYDWSRLIETHKPDYYKWDQWIFLKMFEKGLAYRKKAAVNYCEKCKTVLANEQVHNGKCWRHEDTNVEIKHLEQWFLKITKYADELYDVSKLKNWPEKIKTMQENWIGKSYGVDINFDINGIKWPIFTTRLDTIYGVTFMVVSSQHPKLFELVTEKQKSEVEKFLKKIKSTSEKDIEELEKEGVFTGSYATNPLTHEKVPVYVGNFVLAEYGSGMVMAVPGHDARDFEFAKKYNLPIKEVIKGGNVKERAYVNEGILVNSGQFSGMNSKEAIEKISKYIEKQKLGKRTINYKLRDWLISRQRYWGTPIPIIYCDKCGIVTVPEKDLPVKLPEKVKFGKGNPLATNKKFLETKCPKCKGKARRETDTMDTFVNSSWYFLRYCDNKNKKKAFDNKKIEYWMPVDQYIGGAEHACMHLIYARFFVKALRDLGFVKFDEPFLKLFNQGMLLGADGNKMSKSLGNIVNPIDMINKYSADALRFNLMSLASPDTGSMWSDRGIESSFRFLSKVYEYFPKIGKSNKLIESKLNKTIKEVSDDIENFRYNLAIIKIRELFDYFEQGVSKKDFCSFLKMFSVFCPHISEELWHKLGNKSFISLEKWPVPGKIDENLLKEEEQIEKLIEDIKNILEILENRNELKNKKKIKIFAIPKELEIYSGAKEKIKKIFNMEVEILDIREASKIGKIIKAQPGKPGIYVSD